jgi:oligoendopeptidase F
MSQMPLARVATALVALCLTHVLAAATPATPATQPKPAAAAAPPAQAGWDLRDLYPTEAAWNDSYARLKTQIAGLSALKGTLGNGAPALRDGLVKISDAAREYLRLAVYASLDADADVRVSPKQERNQQAQALGTTLSEQTAWVNPEILAIGADKVRAFIAADEVLKKRFDFQLDNVLRAAPHTLSAESEGVLAAAGNVLAQPDTLHTVFSNGELPLPSVTLHDGTKVKLSEANYEKYRQVSNRADRKLVFDAFWASWKKFEGTFGTMLSTQMMGDVFKAKTRHFDSSLDSALFPDNMPSTVYRRLVAETNAGLPTLHRYLKLRKRVLGVTDELRYYDNYPPLFPLARAPTFSVDDAKRITLEALAPLGEDYLSTLRQGFAGQWMSVYPAQGKKSGAYMNGSAYDVHPYLLLNHNNDFQSVSTFAHEWGHAVHTLLAARAQPFDKSNYPTFTAESASIGNEMLLSDYMVAHAKNRAEKLYYLGAAVESIRQTFFRQVMFAEFELAIHEEVEQGRPLSGARMNDMYCGLLRRYYGEASGVMKIDPAYCSEWTYVPHFYYNFYLYQYATSMAGAAWLTAAIEKEGAPAREKFLSLLSAGGSDYPYELYKRAGLDMAQPTAYQALIARMNKLLDEIEALEKQGST